MIFNKSSKGAEELKSLIGFIYKSIRFENMITYIEFATRDIQKLIGKEVYLKAEDHYKSENYQLTEPDKDHPEYAILDQLVGKIQLPIALHAYRRYAPSGDVTHSDKGRQIFVSEEEKPAFEWQIDKDDQNLLNLANEAVDVLLEFLDDHIDDKVGAVGSQTILIPWGTSKQYEQLRKMFVNSVDDFEKVFPIMGSRRILLYMLPFLSRIQLNVIRPHLSADRYDEIKEQLLDKDLSEQNEDLLDLIRQPIVLLSLAEAVKRLSAQVLPDGIFTPVVSGVIRAKNSTSKIDRNEVSAALGKDGQVALRKLQERLRRLSVEAAGQVYQVESLTERMDPDKKFFRL